MADVHVMATGNGPYKGTGTIELLDHEGNPVAVPGRQLTRPFAP